MNYVYNWKGATFPQTRAASAMSMGGCGCGCKGKPGGCGAMGDWPPVINSGPERGVMDGQQVPMYLRSGPPPTNQPRLGVGDITDLFASPLVLLAAAGIGIWIATRSRW